MLKRAPEDIFYNLIMKVRELKLTSREELDLKMRRNHLQLILDKINLVLNLKAVKGQLLIQCMLQRIMASQELFIMDLE